MKKILLFLLLMTVFLPNFIEGAQESIEMVFVKGGSFQMGTDRQHYQQDGEYEAPDANRPEKPAHLVTLSDFYISRFEVTQKVWKSVMGTNPSYFKGEQRPVESVSWYDAVKFCNKLSEKDGFDPVYTINGTQVTCDFTKNGYRLPTEAEWEYAARGGRKSENYDYAGSNDPEEAGWLYADRSDTSPVGIKKPNELGLYDMTGNVYEWCWDRFDFNYYKISPEKNPTGPAQGEKRALRGGGYRSLSVPQYFTTIRARGNPDDKSMDLGFRIVRNDQ